jgi:DNA (cytosine-5)-methyltransferase 1
MKPSVYYNEIDLYCAQWLRNLMDADLIPRGDIDTRSIEDVTPNDLRGYTQCHFFAGLGGWAYALQLAGWGARPVWTGSCPCQPFSAAGKGLGFEDQRHLWPAFYHLIRECKPTVVFGEQVASKDADPWIDLVHADVENVDYAFGCVPFPAAGINAPHIRDRNYWVAYSNHTRLEGWQGTGECTDECVAGSDSLASRMADSNGRNASSEREQCCGEQRQQPQNSGTCGLANTNSREQQGLTVVRGNECDGAYAGWAQGVSGAAVHCEVDSGWAGPLESYWGNADWLACRDGKWRPVEPGTFPLAHGIPGRVGRLRAYGNAIVAPQAAEFITTYMQARGLIGDQQAVAA